MIGSGRGVVSPKTTPAWIGTDVIMRRTLPPSAVVVSTVTPTGYAIELRDKDFRLKARLERTATDVSWEWNRQGGCGRCSFTIQGDYLAVRIQADDDVRLYLPDSGGTTATLWYRGYVESVTPQLNSGDKGSIRVECVGYFSMLERIIVHDGGGVKTYSSTEISAIVDDIVDTFVTPQSSITAGTIQASSFTPDTLEFKDSAKNCLSTLFDLLGNVEYGVNASLQFFWYNRSETVTDKFWLGGNIVKLADKVDYRSIVNKVFFEGGDVSGTAYQTTGSAEDSIARYGRHEAIVSDGSIITSSVAQQFINAHLSQHARPSLQLSIALKNTTKRFEASLPIGAISVIDRDAVQASALYGTTANGGSNKLYGTTSNSGSGQIYGGFRKEQVDRVIYTLSPENGKVHAEVQFGTSIGMSKASATLKQLEQNQNTVRQRSL